MRALVTGAVPSSRDFCDELTRLGFDVVFQQMESDFLPEGALECGVVACNALFKHHDYRNFKQLKLVQLTSAGYDRVPAREMRAAGIRVHNAGDTFAIPMAEHVLCCTLMLLRHMPAFGGRQRGHAWEKDRSLVELNGKTVCILGCGNVGLECAKRFAAFGANVIGIARHPENQPRFTCVCAFSEFEKLLPVVDVLVLAVPLNESTRGLMNRATFALMKESAILINVSRGQIVREGDLAGALAAANLAGAALDVFEEEPLSPESPLWDMENVIITPHNSFVGEGNTRRFRQIALANIGRFVEAEDVQQ